MDWSDWQPLSGWTPAPEVLAETLDGGQAFRWSRTDKTWTGHWSENLVQVRLESASVQWRCPASQLPTARVDVPRYLGADRDWAALTDSLPWRSDPHLARCLAAFPQLRVLRQPFGETLLGFLCSATKQIVQIKQMIALLAERHGLPGGWPGQIPAGQQTGTASPGCRAGSLTPPPTRGGISDPALQFKPHRSPLSELRSPTYSSNRLPTWTELARVPEKELRACLLGFRAGYIAATARYIADRPGWLDETEQLPYADAKARLLELPGVGEKVADCVLLFGAGRLEAFPVDTWIIKSLERRYGLAGWKPAQIAHFGRTHFGPLAGLAQQYLFSWERQHGSR